MEIKIDDYDYLKKQAGLSPIFAHALNEYERARGEITQYELLIGLIKILTDVNANLEHQLILTYKNSTSPTYIIKDGSPRP